MKLPADSNARDKLRRYLLLQRPEDDKSKFLELAGYTPANWDKLEQDIRSAIQENEAFEVKSILYLNAIRLMAEE